MWLIARNHRNKGKGRASSCQIKVYWKKIIFTQMVWFSSLALAAVCENDMTHDIIINDVDFDVRRVRARRNNIKVNVGRRIQKSYPEKSAIFPKNQEVGSYGVNVTTHVKSVI